MKRRKVQKKWSDDWKETDLKLPGGRFDLNIFRLDIMSLVRDKVPEIYRNYEAEEWNELSDDEKINKLLKDSKSKKWVTSNSIYNLLDRVLKKVLERVYNKYYPKKKMSKSTRIYEMISCFFGEKTPVSKRKEEEENIRSIDIDEELSHTVLCDITIPNEIISLIFDFLERNLQILTTAGSVCQHFYIKLLSSWDHIEVHSHNLNNISLLALQSTKSLKFEFINQSEQRYMWKHAGKNSRLKKITIGGSNKYIRSALSLLQKLKKKKRTPYPCRNVEELSWRPNTYKFTELKKTTLSQLFPKLRKVGGGYGEEPIIKLFKKCPQIDDIQFNRTWAGKGDLNFFLSKKHLFDPNFIKKLRFDISVGHLDDPGELSKLINFFPNLESLHFTREVNFVRGNYGPDPVFEIGKLFQGSSNTIKKLSIVEKLRKERHDFFSKRKRQMGSNEYVNSSTKIIYPKTEEFESIEHFEITLPSPQQPNGYISQLTELFDFNLEEMVLSDFLTQHASHLKTFRAENISLEKRSRSFEHLFSSNRQEELEREMKVFANAVTQFATFLTSVMVEKFEEFEVIIRNNDAFFKNEMMKISYDKKTTKRLRIQYEGEDVYYSLNGNKDQCKFLMREKKPCLMLLQVILKELISSMLGLDIILFEVVEKSNLEMVLKERLGGEFEGNEIFAFDDSDMMVVKKKLL